MKYRRILFSALLGIVVGTPIAAILATENALHIQERPVPGVEAARALARQTGAVWESAQIRAPDGVTLDAWLFMPAQPNRSAVILLHGVADTRRGVLSHAHFLVRNGFTDRKGTRLN